MSRRAGEQLKANGKLEVTGCDGLRFNLCDRNRKDRCSVVETLNDVLPSLLMGARQYVVDGRAWRPKGHSLAS
jgi:hypothetical protein